MKRMTVALLVGLALASALLFPTGCGSGTEDTQPASGESESATQTEQHTVPGAERAQEAVDEANEAIEQRTGDYSD